MIPVMVWVPAKVGSYWSCGDWYISTYHTFQGPCDDLRYSGYLLTRNREEIGRYATLEEAQDAARKHNA